MEGVKRPVAGAENIVALRMRHRPAVPAMATGIGDLTRDYVLGSLWLRGRLPVHSAPADPALAACAMAARMYCRNFRAGLDAGRRDAQKNSRCQCGQGGDHKISFQLLSIHNTGDNCKYLIKVESLKS